MLTTFDIPGGAGSMRITRYESIHWRIVVPSNEGYDLTELKKLFAEQGVRPSLTITIQRHPIGFIADERRQVRWHEEIRKGIRTLVIDLHRRVERGKA
jgi:hypothetical protein